MNQVTLQIPISKTLKAKAEKAAYENGFSTLVETVKKLIIKFANRKLVIEQKPESVTLSPRAKRRYAKAIREIKLGIGVTKTKNVEELLQLLHK